ncbi:hypothetical protein [Paracoccus salipaludis]|uniref:hypothetical protein n=1 Tax=Paracoccus salipaludis TaxID=2032623 RepID=UPI00107189A8|nr:hypothetical protein [Paracoccus salipaludis]
MAVPKDYVWLAKVRAELEREHMRKADLLTDDEARLTAIENTMDDMWQLLAAIPVFARSSTAEWVVLEARDKVDPGLMRWPAGYYSLTDNGRVDVHTCKLIGGLFSGSDLLVRSADFKAWQKDRKPRSKGGRPEHPAKALYASQGFKRGDRSMNVLQKEMASVTGKEPPSETTIRTWERSAK